MHFLLLWLLVVIKKQRKLEVQKMHKHVVYVAMQILPPAPMQRTAAMQMLQLAPMQRTAAMQMLRLAPMRKPAAMQILQLVKVRQLAEKASRFVRKSLVPGSNSHLNKAI